jgi:hypothetical protein
MRNKQKEAKKESICFECALKAIFLRNLLTLTLTVRPRQSTVCDYHSLCFGLQPCRNRGLPRDYLTERPPPEYPSLFAGKHFEVYKN